MGGGQAATLCATASCWSEVAAASLFWLCALLCAAVLLLRRRAGRPAEERRDAAVVFLSKLQLALVVAADCAVALRCALVAALPGDSLLAALFVAGSFALALPWPVAQALQRQRRAGPERAAASAALCIAAAALLGCAGGLAYSAWLRRATAAAFATSLLAATLLASLAVVTAAAAFAGQGGGRRDAYERLSLREVGQAVPEGEVDLEHATSLAEIEARLENDKEGQDGELEGEQKEEEEEKKEEEEEGNEGGGEQGTRAARRFLFRSIGQEADLLAAAVVIGVVMVAGQLGQSFLWGSIVALVSAPGPQSGARDQLLEECLALLYVVLAYSMLLGLQSVLVKVASLRVAASARIQLFASVLGRSLQFHNICKPGELMSRLSNDADAISESTSHAVVVIRGT